MIYIDLIAHVYRPLTQVFDFIADPDNDFQWQYGTLASSQISKGQVAVGSLFRTVAHFMGRRMESINEVTEYEPNHLYAFRSLSGPVDVQTSYTFEMSASSTQVRVSTRLDQRDLFKVNDSVVEKKFKRQYKENFAILKNILESQRFQRVRGQLPVIYEGDPPARSGSMGASQEETR